jgi:hypothetical protein
VSLARASDASSAQRTNRATTATINGRAIGSMNNQANILC